MSIAQAVFVILSASATVLGGLVSLLWWVFRRGQASGAEKARHQADQRAQAQADAKIQALEKLVTEMRAELASMQPKRRRLPRGSAKGLPGDALGGRRLAAAGRVGAWLPRSDSTRERPRQGRHVAGACLAGSS
jgi:hypothetical protein